MAQLVTLPFVKQALRIAEYGPTGAVLPHEDDTVLSGYILTAQEVVLRYMKKRADPDWNEETAPRAVRQSVVMIVQSLYEPDQTDLLGGLASSDPKNPIVAMLCMLRRPTVA